MSGGVRKGLTTCLILAALAMLGLIMLAVLGGVDLAQGMTGRMLALVLFTMIGVGALWAAITVMDGHFDELERLRADIITIDPNDPAPPARWKEREAGLDEAWLVALALADLLEHQQRQATLPDQRLSAMLATSEAGLAAITDAGLISLINAPALSLLGRDRARVGASIFQALRQDSLTEALRWARAGGSTVSAALTLVDGTQVGARVAILEAHGAAVLHFPPAATAGAEATAELHHDLALHDRPPAIVSVHQGTPIDELPVVILDTETTGLEITRDRVIQVGAVRAHGMRIFRQIVLDRLVNPGQPIPPRSTAIHGITNTMVAEARAFPEVFGELEELMRGAVVVGHNIGFDLAMLRSECARFGLPWEEPHRLDTGHLISALDLKLKDLNLESVAARFGLVFRGRHTALGDALLAAEVYVKILALLKDRGIHTFGGALDLAAMARDLIAQQKDAGW